MDSQEEIDLNKKVTSRPFEKASNNGTKKSAFEDPFNQTEKEEKLSSTQKSETKEKAYSNEECLNQDLQRSLSQLAENAESIRKSREAFSNWIEMMRQSPFAQGMYFRGTMELVGAYEKCCQTLLPKMQLGIPYIHQDIRFKFDDKVLPDILKDQFNCFAQEIDCKTIYDSISVAIFGSDVYSEMIKVAVVNYMHESGESVEDIVKLFVGTENKCVPSQQNLETSAFYISAIIHRPIVIYNYQSEKSITASCLNAIDKFSDKPPIYIYKSESDCRIMMPGATSPIIIRQPKHTTSSKDKTDTSEQNIGCYEQQNEENATNNPSQQANKLRVNEPTLSKRKLNEVCNSPRNTSAHITKKVDESRREVQDISNIDVPGILHRLHIAPTEDAKLKILSNHSSSIEMLGRYLRQYDPIKYRSNLRHSPATNYMLPEYKRDFGLLETGADGRCLYFAVSQALCGSERLAPIIKLAVLGHIQMFQDDLNNVSHQTFSVNDQPAILSDLLKEHSKPKAWGDEFTMYAISEVLQRPLLVSNVGTPYGPWKSATTFLFNFNPNCINKEPIYLCLRARHFEPMIPKQYHITAVSVGNSVNLLANLDGGYNLIRNNFAPMDANVEFDFSDIIEIENLSLTETSQLSTEQHKGAKKEKSDPLRKVKTCKFKQTKTSPVKKVKSKIKNLIDDSLDSHPNLFSKMTTKKTTGLEASNEVPSDVLTVISDYPEIFYEGKYADGYHFHCKPCKLNNKKTVIKYPLVPSESESLVKLKLRQLRKSLKRHYDHNCPGYTTIEKERETGLLLARLAYTAVRLDHNHSRYEDYVAIEASLGKDVGDLNHSRKFSMGYALEVYEVLRNKLSGLLQKPLNATGRPTPVAFVVDKYTCGNMTGQIVGLVGIVSGKVKDFFVHDGKVQNPDGEGLGHLIHTSLNTLLSDKQLLERLCSGSGDGEFIKKNIFGGFLNSIEASEAMKAWLSFSWDSAHILQLCLAKTRTHKSISTLNSVAKIVHEVNKHYRHSHKNYQELCAAAASLNRKVYKPLQDSATRFLNHHHQVLHNFAMNYPSLRIALKDNDVLHKMEKASFVAALSLYRDISHELAKLSADCQRVGEFNWNIDQNIAETFEKLEEMIATLPNSTSDSFKLHSSLYHLQQCLDEIVESESYMGSPVLLEGKPLKNLKASKFEQFSNTLSTLKREAQTFLKVFKEAYNERTEPYHNPINDLLDASFSLQRLADNGCNDIVPDEFFEYLQLGKDSGYIQTNLSDNDIGQQYLRMAKMANDLFTKSQHTLGPRQDIRELETEIFQQILTSSNQNIEIAADLLASAMIRTQAESVCESLGSFVKQIMDGRPILFENMNCELMISYNGPKPYSAGVEKLLEEALNRYFKGTKWHFHRSNRTDLVQYEISQVVDNKIAAAAESDRLCFED